MLLSMFSINILSRSCLFVRLSKSFLIHDCERFHVFRNKSILDKIFAIIQWTHVFEIYVQRVFSKMIISKNTEFWTNIIEIMRQWIISKILLRLRQLGFSIKFLYKNLSNLKFNVRFFSKELFQWFRPVTKIDKHHLDITNMLVN